MKRTNQVRDIYIARSTPQKEGRRKKLRRSKTPFDITVIKDMTTIKNDKKEIQNPSQVSIQRYLISPN